ncbi:MAG: valine--tRNA ligase [Phycisphaerales bacterium]|nr:valine--tRNA ligase [Phycisphaerales bacterium]
MSDSQPSSSSSANSNLSGELSKQYKPAEHEQRIRAKWDAAKAFHADPQRVLKGEAKPYAIVIPPPNVTDRLHLGHALNNTLQDVLARSHRMMGYETLWMPGTDHAGIATQAVVERRLKKDENLTRQQLGREKFIAKVQSFKDEYEAIITEQLKLMGCSCDWDRQRFTMDDVCARAVREAFFRLFKDGLIYRGKRLVNWDPVLQTAVADDECYDDEIDSFFYYLRYPLVHAAAPTGGGAFQAPRQTTPVTWNELARRGYPGAENHPGEQQAWVTVATTRPETYLGDTAVAINPKDPRAKSLRGLFVDLPLVGRIIPILEDDYVVLPAAMQEDPEEAKKDPKAMFATGFLKVTPAHDANDYELGFRHKAAVEACGNPVLINIFAPDGSISDKHGWTDVGDAHLFVGLKREAARKKVLEEFKARTVGSSSNSLLAETKPYRHSVKHSDRSKAIIEPYLSDQWYVKVTDDRLAPAANRALVADQSSKQQSDKQQGPANGDGSLKFYPSRYAKTYEQWHDNIRDWCISRQLWWGHRVPVWRLEFAPDLKAWRVLAESDDRQRAEAIADFRAAIEDSIYEFFGESNGTQASDVCVSWTHATTAQVCVRTADATRVMEAIEHFWRANRDVLSRGVAFDSKHDLTIPVAVPCLVGCEQLASAFAGVTNSAISISQDPDVLDTWFSSALWPMSTMGWPNPALAGKDFDGLLQAFNPTTTLCTAREIITLWVSRMVMFNRYLMPEAWPPSEPRASARADAAPDLATGGQGRGPLPFRNVFIHAVIQDGEGRKMSKSLGNGLDPLDIIASHGSDAMRFTLCQMTTQTQDVRMPMQKDPATGRNTSPKFDLGRNFANKLWNAARFTMTMLGGASHPTSDIRHPTSLVDKWMLSRLATAVSEATTAIEQFEYSNYAQSVYDLLWRDFCDWYLEAIKPTVASDPRQQAVLRASLDTILRLLHPIMPYVTEAIYEQVRLLPAATIDGLTLAAPRKGDLLCTAGWPTASKSLRDTAAEAAFERTRALVTALREARSQHQVAPKRKVTLHAPAGLLKPDEAALVQTLALIETIDTGTQPTGAVAITFEGKQLFLSNLRDAAAATAPGATGSVNDAERERLTKLIADSEKSIATLEGRLNNPGYAQKAPPAMVKQTQDQLAKAKADRDAAKAALAALGSNA